MKKYKIRETITDEYVEDFLITTNNRYTVWWCKDAKSAKLLTKEEVETFKKLTEDENLLVYKVKISE